jgi:hypothetical protein
VTFPARPANHRATSTTTKYACGSRLDGFWAHRLLEANRIESHVVDAASGLCVGMMPAIVTRCGAP